MLRYVMLRVQMHSSSLAQVWQLLATAPEDVSRANQHGCGMEADTPPGLRHPVQASPSHPSASFLACVPPAGEDSSCPDSFPQASLASLATSMPLFIRYAVLCCALRPLTYFPKKSTTLCLSGT